VILDKTFDRCMSYVVVVALCLVPVCTSTAGNYAQTVAHYKVSSKSFSIGDITTTQRRTEENGEATVHFETRTAVTASFLWMGYHLDTIEKGTLLKNELVSYSRKGRDNGATIDVEGRLGNSAFRFDVREQAARHFIVIPRNSYDYTTMECPEAHLDFTDKSHITLNILDVEKMAVVKREYHLVRTENYTVAGKEYPCRVVDYTDLNKKARRWISWDGSAVVMYRQDSRGGKSSYSVQATAVTRAL
jgi:hypothetical protein